MSETTTKKWNDETVAQLLAIVGSESPVSAETVAKAAEELEVSERSIASKLRNLEVEVVSLAKVGTSTFTDAQTEDLADFVSSNSGKYTYKELAEVWGNGTFNAKQIQGKVLSLELTEHVKPSEKLEAVRTYTPAEESKFVSLVNAGSFIEDIATALNKTVQSVRGKALSLLRSGEIDKIPEQKESHAKDQVDAIEALGAGISTMTVAEVAAATGKTERGIKTAATRRGISLADYDGKAKREKADAKEAA